MHADQRATLVAFYQGHLRDGGYDPSNARCLGWTSAERQERRFEVLASLDDLHGLRVLDAGAGFGDLFGWLAARGVRPDYVGADVMPEMVAIARQKWPEARFEVGVPTELFPLGS